MATGWADHPAADAPDDPAARAHRHWKRAMNPISSNPPHTVRRSPLTSFEAAHVRRGQHWLNGERLRTYSLVALVCYGVFLLVYLYRTEWQHRPDFGPLAMDFLPFWSASFLALHHHAIDAYNVVALTAVET